MNLFNARDILAESYRNCRGTPFTPIQAFGLPLNEYLPDVCHRQSGCAGAVDGVEPSSPSAEPDATQETNHG